MRFTPNYPVGDSDYSRAITEIIDAAKRYSEFDVWKDELGAAVSHWILSRGQPIHNLGEAFEKKWNHFISDFSINKANFNLNEEDQLRLPLGLSRQDIPFPPPQIPQFTFIDLFAGIGGFRLALQQHGGRCVFSSEWDKAAKETYFNNFGEYPFGDIRQFTDEKVSDEKLAKLVPDHDILAGGFPCQPFSNAGVSARRFLGYKHGFDCSTQGTLFFDLIRIAHVKKPKVLLLENVRNLMTHDGGRTFATIKKTIEDDLGYSFHCAIIDSSTVVPQRRKRCFMVCFRDRETHFEFPDFSGEPIPLKAALEKGVIPEWFTISDKLWEGHIRRTKTNVERGVGFTAYEADLDKPANTIVARYWKDGKECLIPQKNKNPRFLTPRECARLLGFDEKFCMPASPNAAYRQFGNSVVVPVVERLAGAILKSLK